MDLHALLCPTFPGPFLLVSGPCQEHIPEAMKIFYLPLFISWIFKWSETKRNVKLFHFNSFFIYHLGFYVGGDKIQEVRVFAFCFGTHLVCVKMIRDKI